MSTSYYSYIGSYIELPDDILSTITEEQTISCCNNSTCENFHRESYANFCSSCGNKILPTKIEKIHNLYFDYYSFAEVNNLNPDALSQVNKNILIPNLKSNFSSSFNHYEDINLSINSDLVINSIDEFKKSYFQFINTYKFIYNHNLDVKYGLVMFSL